LLGGDELMHYGKLNKTDIANGTGVRVSLFVSGCRNHCKGCFQPETWNFKYGEEFTVSKAVEIDLALKPDYISGLTILGGDPLEPENYSCVLWLCKFIKFRNPNKTIWLYTGYLYEAYAYSEIMDYIDVLVDGKFIEELKDISLKFRGSSNQRIIDVKKTRELGEVVLYADL
jgi:anaerobic ribonucleoside-triphosphate reductase activating protein